MELVMGRQRDADLLHRNSCCFNTFSCCVPRAGTQNVLEYFIVLKVEIDVRFLQHKETQYYNSSLDTATLGLENENSLLTCWQFYWLIKSKNKKASKQAKLSF